MQDGDILYKHRGKVNRHEFIEKSADIYDRMNYLPHHFNDYDYINDQYNSKVNYEDYDYDSFDSDEEQDESNDSEDGTPSF